MKEFSLNADTRTHQIGSKFLKWGITTLWERGSKASLGQKDLRPAASIHIDANVMPADILKQLDSPTGSKLYFIYTGAKQMNHEDDIAIIDELLDDAILLHKYLPVLLALGVDTLLRRISKSDMSKIGHLLKVLFNVHDRTSKTMKRLIIFPLQANFIVKLVHSIVQNTDTPSKAFITATDACI